MDLAELKSQNVVVGKYTSIPEGETVLIDENISNTDTAPSNNGGSNILEPGSKIKPTVTTLVAEKLIERLYGITLESIKELISYDDRNYLVHADKHVKNPITSYSPNGYVLKILNKLDSQKKDFVDAQTELMIFLRGEKIMCPKPIQNVYGKYFSVENIDGTNHIVRLLEYIPGETLNQAKQTKHIYYECGEFLGKMDRSLQKFNHDAFLTHKTVWQLQSLPQLRDFIYVLQDHGRKEIVEQVIDAFESKVLPNIDDYQKSIIHGDFNEQNILVEKSKKDETEYRVCGVIDFGDSNLSPLVFELAIAMTYMIVHSKDLSTGGLVIAGYTAIRTLEDKEKEILKYCVAARLCQSVVMGAYTHALEPDNEYVLTTQTIGWELLQSLWVDKFNQIDKIWEITADKYLKQSIK